MKSEDINNFHHRLALMMDEIHKICMANDIQYTMIGGTLIGAMRHQGFIPWDDDIDIAMTYENYKRFIDIVFQQKHEWLEFCIAGRTPDFYHPFLKVYDKQTTFIEGHTDKPRGIFVDVFPIVCCGDTKQQALKKRRVYRFWQSLLKRKGYTFHTGGGREFVLKMIARCFSVKFLMSKLNNQLEHLSVCSYKLSADFDGTESGIVPTRLFKTYQLYKFEEFEFMGISCADEYLRFVFGDYMQLPPVEKRTPHHIVYMNLNLPYTNYKNER